MIDCDTMQTQEGKIVRPKDNQRRYGGRAMRETAAPEQRVSAASGPSQTYVSDDVSSGRCWRPAVPTTQATSQYTIATKTKTVPSVFNFSAFASHFARGLALKYVTYKICTWPIDQSNSDVLIAYDATIGKRGNAPTAAVATAVYPSTPSPAADVNYIFIYINTSQK
jgi:hypothetical protein